MQAQQFWTKAYQRNIGKMIGMNFRYVGDRALAEDLAHDAFLKAIEKSESYRHLGSFGGWLMRLNLNNTLDWLRRQPKYLSVDEYSDDLSDDVFEMPQCDLSTGIDDVTESDILDAISRLPDKQRMVFNLYVFEKQKHTKIAETLQIGERSSKRYLSEARAQLQQTLKKMKEHKKSGIMILLSLISLRGHAVDRLCRAKLKHLSLTPAGSSPLTAFQWATVPQPSSWLVLSAVQGPVAAGVTGVGVAAAVAGSMAIWQAQPSERTSPRIPESAIDTIGAPLMVSPENPDTIICIKTTNTSSLMDNESDISTEQNNPSTEQQTQCPAPTQPETRQTIYSAPKSYHSLKKFWRSGYCGLQDEKGNIIVYPKYSDIGPFDKYWSGWAMVDLFGFKGFIDSTGREIVHPQYDEIGDFRFSEEEWMALVRKGKFYGFINLAGEEVVPVKLHYIQRIDGTRIP